MSEFNISPAKDGTLTITGIDVSGAGKRSSTGKSDVIHTSRTKLDDGVVVQLLVYRKV